MRTKLRHLVSLTGGAALLACAPLVGAAQTPTPRPAADSAKAAAAPRPAPSPAADSLVRELKALKGYTVVEYEGESASFRADSGVLRLEGNAQVTREDQKLTADTIVYLRNQNLVEAFGHPTVSGEAQEIEGNVLVYDFARKRAMVRGGRTKFTQGTTTWLVQGDVTAEGGGVDARFYTTSGCFTTDDRFGKCLLTGDSVPQYHFEADRIMMVRNKLIVARPARLYFRNVPVFWLPFVVQNLEKGRRSGLLVPQFGLNDIVQTSSRQSREISNLGFYWAINDYLGGQLSGGWRSGSYTSITGALDYSVRSQFFGGNVVARQFWRDEGGQELTFSTSNSWKPDERTTLGLTASYATSADFIRRTSTEYGEAVQDLTSSFRADRRFDWGTVALGADRRQSISNGKVDMTLPSFSISPNSITLFPSLDRENASWYNNANLKLGASGSYQTIARPLDLANALRGQGDESRLNLSGNQNFQVGNLTWSADGVEPHAAGSGRGGRLRTGHRPAQQRRRGLEHEPRVPVAPVRLQQPFAEPAPEPGAGTQRAQCAGGLLGEFCGRPNACGLRCGHEPRPLRFLPWRRRLLGDPAPTLAEPELQFFAQDGAERGAGQRLRPKQCDAAEHRIVELQPDV